MSSLGIFAFGFFFLLIDAVPINRTQFKTTAVNYAPSVTRGPGGTDGAVVLTDGFITVTGGFVTFLAPVQNAGFVFYHPGYRGPPLLMMTFASPVQAMGLDWISDEFNPRLSVYNAQNVLLENLILDWTLCPTMGNPECPYGFIGIDVGEKLISYATLDTVDSTGGNEVYIGRWIYQPGPDASPSPSLSQQPSASPEPSASQQPSSSPEPSPSPEPSSSPEPSLTPQSSPIPSPEPSEFSSQEDDISAFGMADPTANPAY
jgi:hypothetical protein